MISELEQLKEMTVVVADTGDVDAVRALKPVDCTTNPSIVLKALQTAAYEALFEQTIEAGRAKGESSSQIADALTVGVGAELASHVPGRVSTEVDAVLSFDTDASIRKGRALTLAYEERGLGRDKILIKLAATWEGIRAAEVLQGEGINCNLTLVFSLAQAVACADAGAFLISPFVGRITDWHVKSEQRTFSADEDPGVKSVKEIYEHYKSHGIQTIVMGASFRSTDQIKALAGCDRLTIAPQLLQELASNTGKVPRQLSVNQPKMPLQMPMSQSAFRWAMNDNAMATEKLAEGIRGFDTDHRRLLTMICARLSA